MSKWVGMAVLGALAAGCFDPAHVPPTSKAFWACDDELQVYALSAADRIERATGLVVPVVDDPAHATPIVWEGRADTTWRGHGGHMPGGRLALIAAEVPTELRATAVLHEMLHTLGVGHVPTGEGVMSLEIFQASPLTNADLAAICSAVACAWMAPEVAAN